MTVRLWQGVSSAFGAWNACDGSGRRITCTGQFMSWQRTGQRTGDVPVVQVPRSCSLAHLLTCSLAQEKTIVLFPWTRTRSSTCQITARASTARSIWRPIRRRSSAVSR